MVLEKACGELFDSWFLLRNLFYIIEAGQIQGKSDNLINLFPKRMTFQDFQELLWSKT